MRDDERSESSTIDRQEVPEKEVYRVVVLGHLDDLTGLSRILAHAALVHPDDAMSAARCAPGVLPIGMSRHDARSVAIEIGRQGLAAVALPEAEIPNLNHAEVVHHACCGPHGLIVVGMHNETERLIRWADLSLLSLGSVPMETARRLSAESAVVVHAASNPHRASVEMSPHAGMILWLACDQPFKIYRIVHNQMNYEYLGERKSTSAMRNFALFVEDLSQRSPRAYLTPATRAFLRHGPHRHFAFRSAPELSDYTVLHLVLQRLVDAPLSSPSVPTTANF